MALASTDCPTPLPAQYRRRWGVSRPCSGRERVGPPRVSHQGHALTRGQPRGLARAAPGSGERVMRTRGRAASPRLCWWGVSRSCRPGVVHERG